MIENNQLVFEIQNLIKYSPHLLSKEIQFEIQKIMEQQLKELIEIRKNQDLLFTQTNKNTKDIARLEEQNKAKEEQEEQNKAEIARLKNQINNLCREQQKLKGLLLQNIFSAM